MNRFVLMTVVLLVGAVGWSLTQNDVSAREMAGCSSGYEDYGCSVTAEAYGCSGADYSSYSECSGASHRLSGVERREDRRARRHERQAQRQARRHAARYGCAGSYRCSGPVERRGCSQPAEYYNVPTPPTTCSGKQVEPVCPLCLTI